MRRDIKNGMVSKIALVMGLIASLLVVGCTGRPNPAQLSKEGTGALTTVKVVAATDIVADWVKSLGGDLVIVHPMVANNVDPHTFRPRPSDVTKIEEADLLFLIGGQYEAHWWDKLSGNLARDSASIVYLGDYAGLLEFEGYDGDHVDGVRDPHFWHDPIKVMRVVNQIAETLGEVDEDNRAIFDRNAARYLAELIELDGWINKEVQKIPEGKRVLVTNHETMRYFALRYGFQVLGTIVQSGGSGRNITPRDVIGVVDVVRDTGIDVIFVEPQMLEKIARSVSEDTGVSVAELYSESLGPNAGGADTYLGMMRANVQTLVDQLQ